MPDEKPSEEPQADLQASAQSVPSVPPVAPLVDAHGWPARVSLIQAGITFWTLLLVSYMIWALVNQEIPTSNRDLFNIALGTVLGWTGSQVLGFYFGGSLGQSKDAGISVTASMSQRPPGVPAQSDETRRGG